jgi:hypothetical protein
MTLTAKAAVGTADVVAGTYAVDRYLTKHEVTVNGKRATIGAQNVRDIAGMAKKAKDILGFLW